MSKRRKKGYQPHRRVRTLSSASRPLHRGKRILHFVPAYNLQVAASAAFQIGADAASAMAAGHEWVGYSEHNCDLTLLRNRALHKALAEGFDYLFMQDADVYSPGGSSPLLQLIAVAEETGAAMAGAMVMLRTRPPRANVHPFKPGAVFEVERMGTGMVLVNLDRIREWYDEFKGPCFNRTYQMYGDEESPHNPMREPKTGSDIWFCKIIRAHGQSIWCDSRIPTTHQDCTHAFHYDGHSFVGETDAAATADSPDPAGNPESATAA